MKILLVGGGSGGHITPLLAVASQLKRDYPEYQTAVITEKLGVFNHLFDDAQQIDSLYFINAGKFRRYHGESYLRQLFDIKTILFNIRDFFRIWIGLIESFWLMLRIRPNVVFIKGGYVGVPVGFVARLLRIPYVTHDSDASAGLTNRLIAKRAAFNAVGMPPEHYSYPQEKIAYVGIPVTDDFLSQGTEARTKKRSELDLNPHDLMLLITGGSNGAKRLDKIIHKSLQKLLEKNSNLHIVHQVGRDHENLYEDYPTHLHARLRVANFLQPLSAFIAASDIVITRAGATALAEIGHQKTAAIIVPNPYLTGGHQVKNAQIFSESNSALVVDEQEAIAKPVLMAGAIEKLIDSKDLREKMGANLYKLTQKHATKKIAKLLVSVAEGKGKD